MNARVVSAAGIAEALLSETRQGAMMEIAPPWEEVPFDRSAFDSAWSQVQTLKRQRAELLTIWPAKSEQIETEFKDAVRKVAAEFKARCESEE